MWHMSYSCGWDFFSFLFFASIWKCICTWYNFRLSRFVVYLKAQFYIQLKFGFSEKATKFEKIFVVLLTRVLCSVRATANLSKSWRRFLKTNVAKLYYTNFKGKKMYEDSLDSIPSPSSWVKIQIIGGKVYLRCNKANHYWVMSTNFFFKSFLTTSIKPSHP